MGVAARAKALRTRPGPKEPALRHARVCYDHLAGDLGVALFDAFHKNKWIIPGPEKTFTLTKLGRVKVQTFGVDLDDLENGARPVCRACLDWRSAATTSLAHSAPPSSTKCSSAAGSRKSAVAACWSSRASVKPA